MAIRTFAQLRTEMPVGVEGAISAQDINNFIDTMESLLAGSSAPAPNVRTGTTYTLVSGDNGALVAFTGASAVTLTLPNNLAVGFRCTVGQIGAGQITFTAGSGATIVSVQSLLKTALTGSGAELWVYENTGGTAAKYWLAGDLAA